MTFYVTIKQLLNTQSLFTASKLCTRLGLDRLRSAEGMKKNRNNKIIPTSGPKPTFSFGKAVTLVPNPQRTSGFIHDWGLSRVASATLFNRYSALCGLTQ